MEVLFVRNVEEAYTRGIDVIKAIGEKQSSRAGDVLVADCPVMTVYEHPGERVLFDPGRDANPFFHLFEALWILAGRDDAVWLDKFVKDFSERFSEPGGFIYGAYGYRFRKQFKFDQIDECVDKLRANPLDRRVVLQMWDPLIDFCHGEGAKDLPCNTQIYPRILRNRLDLTICCRSNDIIWGAYGANAVHFSVLQEYLAGRIGVAAGRLYQLSNNWHAYVDVLDKVGQPNGLNWYSQELVHSLRMGEDWAAWDEDLLTFMEWTENPNSLPTRSFYNNWFVSVAIPMYLTIHYWREGDKSKAKASYEQIAPCDWRVAAEQWIERRTK